MHHDDEELEVGPAGSETIGPNHVELITRSSAAEADMLAALLRARGFDAVAIVSPIHLLGRGHMRNQPALDPIVMVPRDQIDMARRAMEDSSLTRDQCEHGFVPDDPDEWKHGTEGESDQECTPSPSLRQAYVKVIGTVLAVVMIALVVLASLIGALQIWSLPPILAASVIAAGLGLVILTSIKIAKRRSL